MPQELYTPEDIRDLISQAISDSMDMDWQPGWGADAVVKALADAGLVVVPDPSTACPEPWQQRAFTYIGGFVIGACIALSAIGSTWSTF